MPTRVATYQLNIGTGTTVSVAASNAGELLVCMILDTSTSGSGVTAVSGGGLTWTQRVSRLGPSATRPGVYIFTATATGGSFTLTITGGVTGRSATVTRWSDAAVAASPVTASAASGSVSLTTTVDGSAIQWARCDYNEQSPTGTVYNTATAGAATALYTYAAGSNGHSGWHVAHANAGTAGAKTVGATPADSGGMNIAAIEIIPGFTAIDAGGDSGTGDDVATVDKTDLQNLTDAGTGDDVATVFADQDPLGDAGTGDDVIAVEQLTPIGPVTDSGTGDDTVSVANFLAHDLVETGTGDDVIDVVRTTFVDLTDAGTGDDAHDLLQQLNTVTDSGTGTEVLEGLGTPQVVDAGTADDVVYIRDIPYTQVLPPQPTNIYDLVVVARIPQPSGPPTFVEVDPIEWRSLEYTNTLNRPQGLQASCQIASLTEPVLQRLRSLHTLATELWLYRNGRIVFAGPVQGWQSQGETLTLRARGLQHYLRMMVVDSDKRFEQVDQFQMVKWLVDQWQALEYGNFGIDTSAIASSGVLRDGTYLRSELHNVGQRVEDLGARRDGFDLEVDPSTRRLQLFYPLKGVDRSTGEDAIVLDTRNITSSDMLCSVAPEDLASEAYGSGSSVGADESLLSVQANPTLRAVYGRTAVTGTWYDVSEQATLDAHTQGLLDPRDTALIVPGPRVRVTPDADLEGYGVGDTVTYDLLEPLGVSAAFRIHEQRVVVAPTGDESVDLEFV